MSSKWRTVIKHGSWIVSLTSGGIYLSVHSIFAEKYKEALHLYQYAKPAELNERMKSLVDETLRDVNAPADVIKKLHFFPAVGSDVYSFGSLHLPTGAYIGLPFNYTYQSTDDINTSKLRVLNGQTIKWQTPSGKQVLESLVLGDKAIKFAIAHELFYSDSYRVHLKAALITSSLYSIFLVGTLINRFGQKSRIIRFFNALVSPFMGYASYCVGGSYLNWRYEVQSDIRAISLGTAFYDGGVEYYEKRLQMNKAFRKMLKEDGKKYFTKEGNEVAFLIQKHVPLTERLAIMEEFMYPGQMNKY